METAKVHFRQIVTQQGTGRVFYVHACGTGCKVSELSSTLDLNKISCIKCLKLINNRGLNK